MVELTEREKLVLGAIIRSFILRATPVASYYIARESHLPFSPATIRNIMASLEEKGYIYQPHTSAGRVPTTAGYRLYVDQMMRRARLSNESKQKIRQAVLSNPSDYENILREATRILAHLSRQLGIFITPHLDEGVFHRIEITRLTSERILLILAIKSGLVKTIVLELPSDIPEKQLEVLSQVLNERLHGLRIREIRQQFREIVKDIEDERSGLIHLFIQTAREIFNFSNETDIFLTGTHHILSQPEFSDANKISGVVELLENKNIIIHLLDDDNPDEEVTIKIGEEIEQEPMRNCSIIAARYRIGEVSGKLGIIGPTRMDYDHLVPLVDFTARLLSESFRDN